jgi:SAM-dependent methyltransferase
MSLASDAGVLAPLGRTHTTRRRGLTSFSTDTRVSHLLPLTKIIDRADFDAPDLRPFLEEMATDEMVRFGLTAPAVVPDSKQWECAMMLRALDAHNVLRPGALIAGVGAGTEQTTFALAARGCVVFPSDRYLEATPWSDVAPPSMMLAPAIFTNFQFPVGHVIPIHGDARRLPLPSGLFDGVYSAGSIEHFGSLEAVAAAAEEIGRILKPGGVATISTEFRLDGPQDRRWFDDNCILFTRELIDEWIVAPSGLELVGKLEQVQPSDATYDSRVVLVDFLSRAAKVQSLADKQDAYPNLVLFHEGFLFCSVHLTLVKPADAPSRKPRYSAKFEREVDRATRKAAEVLAGHAPASSAPHDAPTGGLVTVMVPGTTDAGEQLNHVLNSRSWRLTAPFRRMTTWVREHGPTYRLAKWAADVVRAVRRR